MDHAPEEYGEYWAGAIRIAAGVLAALLAYRLLTPFRSHHRWPPRVLAWAIFAVVLLVACFAASLGIARIVAAATGRR